VIDNKAEELTKIHNSLTFIHPGIAQMKKICSGIDKMLLWQKKTSRAEV
jgi:hypothetical protein